MGSCGNTRYCEFGKTVAAMHSNEKLHKHPVTYIAMINESSILKLYGINMFIGSARLKLNGSVCSLKTQD